MKKQKVEQSMQKTVLDEPKWKYLNEHRKMCGPYSLRQLMDGLKAGFLQGDLPIYGVEGGKLGKPVALKALVEGVGGCDDTSLKSRGSSPHMSREKMGVPVQVSKSSGKVKEAAITSCSSSRNQGISFPIQPSSSATAQYCPPSMNEALAH